MFEQEHLDLTSTRRDFLKSSAVVAAAVGAGYVEPTQAAALAAQTPSPAGPKKDSYAIAARFNKFLRVTDRRRPPDMASTQRPT